MWIRDVVHVVRNDKGEAEALIGFMFDITERKKTERKLPLLQKELEVLSFKDGLTNIANRRPSTAVSTWSGSGRATNASRCPCCCSTSIISKQYNDLYGRSGATNAWWRSPRR